MINRVTWRRTVGAFALVFAGGCASAPPNATVSGTVTLDGKPVTGGAISFIPQNGNTVTAAINPDGSYVAEGVSVGEALVAVHPPAQDDDARNRPKKFGTTPPPPPPPWPARYTDGTTSGLKHTVQAGPNTYNPDLKKS
jgi:hypothetical protein